MNAILQPITYGQLVAKIKEFKLSKKYADLDIYDQPVTFSDPNEYNCYYNIGNLVKETDGHFSMIQE